MIAFPANLIIVSIFRYAKERPPKMATENKRLEKLQKIAQKEKEARTISLDDELMREKDFISSDGLKRTNESYAGEFIGSKFSDPLN